MQQTRYDKEFIKNNIVLTLQRQFGCTIKEATSGQIYRAVAVTVRDQIMEQMVAGHNAQTEKPEKKLYYLSIEFLMGRSLHSNMVNLCSTKAYREALDELGLDLADFMMEEPEPGLGNGGLGRLAACFMDSLATLNLPAMGCTLRYEYGLFRQKIVDGQQLEMPDSWLEKGNVWEVAAPQDSVEVRFGGWVDEDWSSGELRVTLRDYTPVIAVPYDMPVIGYNTDTVNTLRMWSARAPQDIDLGSFGRGQYQKALEVRGMAELLCKVLYPEDNHWEGKHLRLQQQYFFTSATLQYMLRDYKREYGDDLEHLPDHVAIHINDTHPALAIPELIRLLIDEEGLSWEKAEYITTRTIAYTNHTILSEALERWGEDMMSITVPRVYQILKELNRRLCDRLWKKYPGDWDRIASMAIIAYDKVHMANLCVAYTHQTNGVSQLHGDILKRDTFKDYYQAMPEKFSAITNGITIRRWLMLANPGLATLIDSAIGDGWRSDADKLQDLLPLRDDAAFREEFSRVKRDNKLRLSQYLVLSQNEGFDPDFLLDVQAKRLHEYKRQLLNALHLLVLYNRICEDPNYTCQPRCVVFGAKASPGYRRAKLIIRFINAIAKKIDEHPRARQMLKVIFLENYCVSAAEVLIPAADLSEQISTATKEASGTGNMKFMINGALTIGTLDGANIEMQDCVGAENIYIFGARAHEVESIYAGGTYQSSRIFEENAEIRRALTQMLDGSLGVEPGTFKDLYHALLFGDYGQMADPYLVLYDYGEYAQTQKRIGADYSNRELWLRKSIANTACAGFFSSDRTIREYNDNIWHIPPIK